jgi:tRNA (guanine6-N2)-methyltransferase
MSRTAPLPPCYAMTLPGLEEVAADEITTELGAAVKKSARGLVVFRTDAIDEQLLRLRTTEDIFLLAWGTDALTHRAEDLDKIQRWTAREPDWEHLLRLHHALRPKPKGKPTYRLVTQMKGEHAYQRRDAAKALARGLAGRFPASWREAEENAAIEVWLTITDAQAVCGLRLSDRTMRHRTWKVEHRPASLRPTLAAAMVRLAAAGPHHLVCDPMCGAGTILAEQLTWAERYRGANRPVTGGDLEMGAVRAATINLRKLGTAHLARWDATRLPLANASFDRIVCNPPFGKQLGEPEDIGPLYRQALPEFDRILRPGGRAVLLVSEQALLRTAARAVGWRSQPELPIRILGQKAVISVWHKGD